MKAEALLEDIEQFIGESRALLQQGAMMELAGLDVQVESLCEAALRLSGEDRKRYADRLQSLLEELTKLGEEMAASRDAVSAELRDINRHRKAHTAYRMADAKGKKDSE
ncbi:MAG: hypothetical protein KGJ06_03840 [Pseudomonadota bacterium]|nr:hypothetical protein [Pseudomonadota bacterium]